MTAADPRDRIVTPDTDPGRWTPEEKAVARSGRCSRQVAYGGYGLGDEFCREPSEPGASFRDCREHNAERLADEQAGRVRAARQQEGRATR